MKLIVNPFPHLNQSNKHFVVDLFEFYQRNIAMFAIKSVFSSFSLSFLLPRT